MIEYERKIIMKKRKIDTMLEFEQIINYYLANDLPFSLLEEEYDLTLKQRDFMLNRILDYSSRVDELSENIEGNISDAYLNLPHHIEEKTPLDHDELIGMFEERKNLKRKILLMQREVDTNVYDEALKSFLPSEIAIAEYISTGIDFADVDKTDVDEKSLEYYRDLYEKYLLITREKNNYINMRLSDNDRYQELISKFASINDELVYHNIKLANWVVRVYFKGMPFEMEEAQGFALEGLTRAINGFDAERGNHFSSYAVKVIKRNIQGNFVSLVGLSWSNYLLGLNYKRYVQEYTNVTGEKNVTVEDLYNSNLFGLSLSALKKAQKYANIVTIPFTYVLPLDPLESRDKKSEMLKTMDDYEEMDTYEDIYNTDLNLATPNDEVSIYAENKILNDTLQSLMEVLSDDEKMIIRKRYGFDDGKYLSLDKVALELNTTKDKVNRIDKKVQRYLRHPLCSKLLRDFYIEKEVYEGIDKSTYREL